MALVRFAGQLRKLVNGNVELNFTASNISECIKNLDGQFPGIKESLCDNNGELLESINVYVNGDNVRYLNGLTTTLKEEDEVDIMSAFAAG
ncbi:MAG: MoaD/ThiS family protein [Deltaproteobacteria bacterium]|nr:MoaD/ThiS family protein [Deltaproteobacteria bacterium]